jgi:acyl-CoA ligase (AMP-forming) (exosortase A-associated)
VVNLVHELVFRSAEQKDGGDALVYQNQRINYPSLASEIEIIARALLTLGLGRGERSAVYLEKQLETVIALFGVSAAGGISVPINPLLKSEQVAHILCDCNARILVTSSHRLQLLVPVLPQCHDLHTVIVVGGHTEELPVISGLIIVFWEELSNTTGSVKSHPIIDTDIGAILYTSGSVGKPKGVVLSHRNLVAGAKSVCQYLENNSKDRILSVLPLSFDYGFSQLTTAFFVGATSVLINYLLPRDIISAIEKESITGLAAVPHLWIQLELCDWSRAISLRYITSSGGVMPRTTLDRLRRSLPKTKVFLMYGMTEAFRSTFLPPEDIDERPDSIGKAIPNTEVFVLREDGTQCAPGEPGELVHRGSLVALGYWNDPQQTAACFKPLPIRHSGLTIPELAVWSGDTVRMDEAGYLYFIGRRDEMIKTAGYRISPTEVEEIIYATECVGEAAAVGVPHPIKGQAIVVVVTPRDGVKLDADTLLTACKHHLPIYMLPGVIDIRNENLPRNANGKIDRKILARELQRTFLEAHQ